MRNTIGTLSLALLLGAVPAMAQQAKPDSGHKSTGKKPATVMPAPSTPATAAPSTSGATPTGTDHATKPKKHHTPKKKPEEAKKPTS